MKRYQIYPAGPGNDDLFAIDPFENEDGEWVRYEDLQDLFDQEDLRLAIMILEGHHLYHSSETNAYGSAVQTLKKLLKVAQA